jgi:hypothetical protein
MGTGGTPRFVAIDPDGVVIQDGFAIDVDRFNRAVAESGPTVRRCVRRVCSFQSLDRKHKRRKSLLYEWK